MSAFRSVSVAAASAAGGGGDAALAAGVMASMSSLSNTDPAPGAPREEKRCLRGSLETHWSLTVLEIHCLSDKRVGECKR